VLFGNQQFGGLYIALPDMYADQGYQQLKFMVGHLNLQDEVGKLILIAMLHLQLVTGSSQPFFKNTFPKYQKWIKKSHWRSGTARGFLPQGCGFVSHSVDRLSTEPVCVGSRLHKPLAYTKKAWWTP
jgi:hypothetical protein